MATVRKVNLDKVGAVASFICAVHCLLAGVALGLLSVAGLGFIGNPVTDKILLAIAFTLGSAAAWHGYRQHRSTVPALIFVTGLSLVLFSRFGIAHSHGAHTHHGWQHTLGTVVSVVGGLLLVTFHVVNLRLQHQCRCPSCSQGESAERVPGSILPS